MLRRGICLLVMLMLAGLAQAQLTADPSSVPVPPESYHDPDRAVVIHVEFESATVVTPKSVTVSNTRARGHVAMPSQLLLEHLDGNGQVFDSQFAPYPLWVRDYDELDQESGVILESGPGSFIVPLSEALRGIRVTDLALGQELVTIDVSAAVIDFCSSTKPAPEICRLFADGFE